jgi:hypothetical protein
MLVAGAVLGLELILVIKRPKDPLSRRGRGKGGGLRHLHMR